MGTRGAVGLRSRATGVGCLETFPLLITLRSPLSYVHSFCGFTFYERATPVAQERNPTGTRAQTPRRYAHAGGLTV